MGQKLFFLMYNLNKTYRWKWRAALLSMGILLLVILGCTKNKKSERSSGTTPVIYQESQLIFPNPERGFVHNLIVYSEGNGLNASALSLLRGDNVTMVVRMIY